ncbi:MAG: porin [Luteolibacter sp.]|uniref:porin n=1 Tax=Luteolibacter sp. TaxID=1962973 RepID=UPI00326666DB
MKSIQRTLLATSMLGCLSARAGTETSAEPSAVAEAGSSSTATGLLLGKLTGETAMDRAWSAATLYKDENNPILQEFSLQGRLQVQYADGHSDNGHFDIEDYENAGKNGVWGDKFEARRAYLGFKSKWFQNWKLEGQIDVNTTSPIGTSDGYEFYQDIYDLYLTYAPSDELNVSIGKQEVKLSREQEISSKDIVTFERSMVTNMLHAGNLTGIWASGKGIQEHWLYEAGIYANDQNPEFTNFEGGALFLGKIGYDYSAQSKLDSAIVSFRYEHNTDPGYQDSGSNATYPYSKSPAFTDAFAISNDIIQGRFGLTTDLLFGLGFDGNAEQAGATVAIDQSNVVALNIIPTYFIADGVQLVGRLQLASSSDPDGLVLGSRYEGVSPDYTAGKRSSDSKGNAYTSAYLGVNYYIYGNKLKLMNGVEFSHLGGGDYDGATFLSGLRMSF